VQPGAHVLPQPLSPHSFPEHCGTQHIPADVHCWPVAHPQSCGQLRQFSVGSHFMLPQKTSDWHCPERQDEPEGHVPQVPPQPSLPQVFPVQSGWQQTELAHVSPALQPQSLGHALQLSLATGSHVPSPHDGMETHLPASQR